MKILVLPFNVASLGSITVEALNSIDGVEAKGLFVGKHKYQYEGKNCKFIDIGLKNQLLNSILNRVIVFFYFLKLIFWADSVYYLWNSILPFGIDIKIVSLLKKNALIEWVGSEIRNPEVAKKISSYIEQAYQNGYEYAGLENTQKSYRLQKKFSDAAFYPIAGPEMSLFFFRKLFPKSFRIHQRMNIKDFRPNYLTNNRPTIIHAPTAPIAKGSNFIIPIVEELKKNYDFEFILLHGISREKVLENVQNCDVFLDQIIGGSYGIAACEAMAYGKPVMCYLMPAVFDNGLPSECPIVNTNPDNLKEQLISLITNPQLRHEIGVKSRAYAEKYHDADKIAYQIVDIFREIELLRGK